MMMQMSLKDALQQFPKCRDLVLCFGSGMDEVIRENQDWHSRIKVFLYFKNQVLLGWSWLIPQTRHHSTRYYFMVMVKESSCQKGLGRQLFDVAHKYAQKQHRRLIVFPHDETSSVFFNKMKVKSKNKLFWWPGMLAEKDLF